MKQHKRKLALLAAAILACSAAGCWAACAVAF